MLKISVFYKSTHTHSPKCFIGCFFQAYLISRFERFGGDSYAVINPYNPLSTSNFAPSCHCFCQVDYEATKHELRHVQEDLSEMTSEVEAMERLKTIAEQNLAEALNMLQQEREQRHSIRKELDQRIASESMFGLHHLSLLGLGDAHPDGHQTPGGGSAVTNSESGLHVHHVDDGEDHNPALKFIEADFSSPKRELLRAVPAPPQGLVGDLFSEVHVGEIRKLERILEQTEIEKSNLERALEESSARLAEAVAEAAARSADVDTLKAQLEQMSASWKTPDQIPGADPVILEKFPNYESAVLELTSLTKDYEALRVSIQQQAQLTAVASDDAEQPDAKTLVHYIDMVNKLEVKFVDQCQMTDELRTGLGQTKEGLQQIFVNLGQFYGSVCEQAGEVPDKALLGSATDYNEGSSSGHQTSVQSVCDDPGAQDASASSLSKKSTGNSDFDGTLDGPPAVACYKLIEMVQKQIQHVGCVFDRFMEKARAPYNTEATANVDEITELQEQVC